MRVSPQGAPTPNRESQRELEREVQARVHRQMGITAAVMWVIAAGVGFWWIGRVFGVGPLEALRAALPLFVIVLIILALGALLSLGAARAAGFAERIVGRRENQRVDSR